MTVQDQRERSRRSLTALVLAIAMTLPSCVHAQPKVATQVVVPAPSNARALSSESELQRIVTEAYNNFKDLRDGANADYIPELAKSPSDPFGVAIVTADGRVHAVGDVDHASSIHSVSKPFTAALVMQQQGDEAIAAKIGVEPTGMPFNSIMALELEPGRSADPLVNAGAIAAVNMVQAKNPKATYEKILDWYARFAGEKLKLIDAIYKYKAGNSVRASAAIEYIATALHANIFDGQR